jgi:hypothetical protein
MDANDRIINRLERLYSLYGVSDRVDAVVSVGGHAYRQDIRQAAYRFINTHLKADARPVDDSERDIVSEGGNPGPYTIAPEKLRVFPTDADLPKDQLNTKIDEHFVPVANVAVPKLGEFESWKRPVLTELRRVSFGYFPDRVPGAKKLGDVDETTLRLQSEEPIEFRLRFASGANAAATKGVVLVVLNENEAGMTPAWLSKVDVTDRMVVFCEPRGIGATKWTMKNPPNYVARCLPLIGRTVDAGRVWDVIAAAKYIPSDSRFNERSATLPVHVAGSGAAGLICAYAAVLDDAIAGVTVVAPPRTHMDNSAPQFLNVLRVCDVPAALGLVAPRPLSIVDAAADQFSMTTKAYSAANANDRLSIK